MKQTKIIEENIDECVYHLEVGKILKYNMKAVTTKENTGRLEDLTACKF